MRQRRNISVAQHRSGQPTCCLDRHSPDDAGWTRTIPIFRGVRKARTPFSTRPARRLRRSMTCRSTAKGPNGRRHLAAECWDRTTKPGRRVVAQNATVTFPTNLLIANATGTSYQRTVDRLEQASQRLSDAALASDLQSKRGAETVKKNKNSLAETQRLMMEVPRNVSAKRRGF